jgi:membrane dipeptidase
MYDRVSSKEYECAADELHARILTVDSHVDTPLLLCYGDGFDPAIRHDPEATYSQVDFPRMREGGLNAVFFAAWVPQGPRTPAGYAQARAAAREMLIAIGECLAANAGAVGQALSPRDVYRLVREGKQAVCVALENGYPLGTDLSLLPELHLRGVRAITLCHAGNNDICDSATDPQGAEHGGLSDFGRRVVADMNRLGIMVDVSHASDDAFYDIVNASRAPVAATHSCTRAVHGHSRNLSDDMLRALAARGGIVQIALLYVADPDPAVVHVVDHIDHAVRVAGIDHVGIGSDFDGGGGLIDCRDVSEIGAITRELVRRGYSEEQVAKIWGGNIMRVFQEVIDAADG